MKHEIFRIQGMHCSACSAAVERVVKKLPGVSLCSVSLTTTNMRVDYDENLCDAARIIAKVGKAGFTASIAPEISRHQQAEAELHEKLLYSQEGRSIKIALLLSLLLMGLAMLPMASWLPKEWLIFFEEQRRIFAFVQAALAALIIYIGRRFYLSGYKALSYGNPNMDSLVALGSSAAYLYSVASTIKLWLFPQTPVDLYFESSAIVVTLVSLGKHWESASKKQTLAALRRLTDLTPEEAWLITPDKGLIKTAAELLQPGDRVLVKPGSKFPADGTVSLGQSAADEAALSGESFPSPKLPGQEVFAGTINLTNALEVTLTKTGNDTVIAHIVQFVAEAADRKAPIARFADRAAGVFVPIVIGIALLAASTWLLCGQSLSFAVEIFTAVLVIACPCAAGLATPAAIAVGTGMGAENGILIRSGEALEIACRTTCAVLDKTGTVTEGKAKLIKVVAQPPDFAEQLLQRAAAAESTSQHPLALAITTAAETPFSAPLPQCQAYPGLGLEAHYADNSTWRFGSLRWMSDLKLDCSQFAQEAKEAAALGQTPILAAREQQVVGLFIIADNIKPQSREAADLFHHLGLHTVLLTGDNQMAAQAIGQSIGCKEIIAEVLPEEKAGVIAKLQKQGHVVMMIGDGINDAPALVQADIGCAVGSGSDIALDSASIVLMKDDLRDAAHAITLSRITLRSIKQNLFWAFCYNILALPIAAGALYPLTGKLLSPMIGALAMGLSSLCVLGNALRLQRTTWRSQLNNSPLNSQPQG